MKKNLALLALALSMTSLASANESAAKGTAKKEATVVATAVPAPANSSKADNNSGAKRSANPTAGQEGAKDPYAVPLFKDARALGATWR